MQDEDRGHPTGGLHVCSMYADARQDHIMLLQPQTAEKAAGFAFSCSPAFPPSGPAVANVNACMHEGLWLTSV